jgi:hypothetical protein
MAMIPTTEYEMLLQDERCLIEDIEVHRAGLEDLYTDLKWVRKQLKKYKNLKVVFVKSE